MHARRALPTALSIVAALTMCATTALALTPTEPPADNATPVANFANQPAHQIPTGTPSPAVYANGANTSRKLETVHTSDKTEPLVQWPLSSRDQYLTDGFGPRTPICAAGTCTLPFHHGIDLAAPLRAPVTAIADGVVIEAHPYATGGLGVYVVVEHQLNGHTIHTVSAHLEAGSLTVRAGDKVRRGDQLGKLGNTGTSTGPHLHFEVIVDGTHVDPLAWLRKHADGVDTVIRTRTELEVPNDSNPDGGSSHDTWTPPEKHQPANPNPATPEPHPAPSTEPSETTSAPPAATPKPDTPATKPTQPSPPLTETTEPTPPPETIPNPDPAPEPIATPGG